MASDLYVSTAGSDTNTGAQGAPLRTIAAASKAAAAGTTVHVAAGSYAGGFITQSSGTASAPIIYVADLGAKIIGGGTAGNPNAAGWENRGNYVVVKGFEIDGSGSQATSWAFGFYNGGSHVTFQGGTVHDIMTDAAAYSHLTSGGNGGAGIMNDSYYGGSDGNALSNRVYNVGPVGTTSTLVHGIYQTESGKVVDNLVYRVVGDGITSWHNAQNAAFINNTVDQVGGTGLLVGSNGSGTGGGFTVSNNIVSNAANGIYEEGTTQTNNTYTDNVLWQISGAVLHLQNGLTAKGTIQADPRYVNASTRDYRLGAGSPAIDAGTSVGAPSTDLAGAPRPQGSGYDIGAYEAGGTVAPPPDQPPPPPPPTVTPDTLSLVLAEDRFWGDAQFIAKIDGARIGGPTTVTASHVRGESETFNFTGNWGAGTHQVEIDFTNPARSWFGSRALWVEQATYDGTTALIGAHQMTTSQPYIFTVGHA